jgi:hypothetical protein
VLIDNIGADYVPKFLGGAYECGGPCTSDGTGHITPLMREFDQHYGYELQADAVSRAGSVDHF